MMESYINVRMLMKRIFNKKNVCQGRHDYLASVDEIKPQSKDTDAMKY